MMKPIHASAMTVVAVCTFVGGPTTVAMAQEPSVKVAPASQAVVFGRVMSELARLAQNGDVPAQEAVRQFEHLSPRRQRIYNHYLDSGAYARNMAKFLSGGKTSDMEVPSEDPTMVKVDESRGTQAEVRASEAATAASGRKTGYARFERKLNDSWVPGVSSRVWQRLAFRYAGATILSTTYCTAEWEGGALVDHISHNNPQHWATNALGHCQTRWVEQFKISGFAHFAFGTRFQANYRGTVFNGAIYKI